MTWQEVVEHPSLRDLPFKIELNERGHIVMSPTRLSHGDHQAQIAHLLKLLLPGGRAITEAAVQTRKNVKVPDVAWFSPERWDRVREELAASIAPEICVEVASESNSDEEFAEKRALYFEAGAREVWFCDLMGNMTFTDAGGELPTSRLCPGFPAAV